MRKLIIGAGLLLMFTMAAQAYWHGTNGGGSACSNSLVFSYNCNSQYYPVVFP